MWGYASIETAMLTLQLLSSRFLFSYICSMLLVALVRYFLFCLARYSYKVYKVYKEKHLVKKYDC
jgi:hypothetical protein